MGKHDSARDRYPSCVPWWYRVFLQARKVARQSATRWQEASARRRGATATDDPVQGLSPSAANPAQAVNKCVRWMEEDLGRPDVAPIVRELEALKAELTRRGLRFTNTAGNFLPREYHPESERGKLWEDAWVIRHADIRPGLAVLDVGGASTLFSFYLASRGCAVQVVDNDWGNCGTLYNANAVARRMGWALRAWDRDVAVPLPFPDAAFDRVFSICVLEHLPSAVRQFLMGQINQVLKPDGMVGLTFDYDAARPVLLTDRGLRYAHREKLERDVIRPSGLCVVGNTDWVDACPPESFMGSLFLAKHGGTTDR